jgi:hypothetical protein
MLLLYHHNYEKYRLYKDWSTPLDTLQQFEGKLPLARLQLEAHPFYVTLDRRQQRRVSEGHHFSYLTRDQLVARLPFPTSDIRPFYRLFSNQIHATPFSLQTVSNERGRGIENEAERGYISFAMTLLRKYLAASVLGVAQILPREMNERAPEALAKAQVHFDVLTAAVPGTET